MILSLIVFYIINVIILYHKILDEIEHMAIILIEQKNKKATIDPISKKYNKCFQYAITVALNH